MMDEYDTLKAQAWIDKYKVTTSTHPQGALFKNIAQVRNPRLSTICSNAFISALTTIICPLIGNILLSLSNKDELQAPPQTIVLFV
jgi:hypothetical protein